MEAFLVMRNNLKRILKAKSDMLLLVLLPLLLTGATILGNQMTNSPSPLQSFAIMLLTAYLIIATVYAAKYIQDRKDGILQRVKSTGVKTGKYFWGYILSTGIIIGIQVTFALLFFLLLQPVCFLDIGKLLLTGLFVSVFAALYAGVHILLCKREMTANIMASSLAAILSILGGSFVPIEEMPLLMQKISILSPMRWLLELL